MPHVHNALHHIPRLLDAFRSAVGEDTPEFTGIERAGETLTPVIDLWRREEWAQLRGEILYSRHVVAAAAVARLSSAELINPAASGVLAVVSFARVNAVNAEVELNLGAAIAANPVTVRGVARDTRGAVTPPTQGSVCTLTTGDLAAGVGTSSWRLIDQQANELFFLLRPGAKLFVIGDAVNTAMGLTLAWYERRATAGELAISGI